MAEEITPEQIAEYESQLEGIEQLLAASPDDESLLTLKRDLLELLELSKAGNTATGAAVAPGAEATSPNAATVIQEELELPPPPPLEGNNNNPYINELSAESAVEAGVAAAANASVDETSPAAASAANNNNPKKKKKQKIKEFVVPPHLMVQEQDSEAERNRKRRALKALKSKHRQKKKEIESDNKQKSWQSFQKKTKRKGDDSIFATQESVNDRVGVISKKTMTEFDSRKRHKGS